MLEVYAAAEGSKGEGEAPAVLGAKRSRDAADKHGDEDDDSVSEEEPDEEEPSDEVRYKAKLAHIPKANVEVQKMAKEIAVFKDVDPSVGRPRPTIAKGSFLEVFDPTRLRAWAFPPSMRNPAQMAKLQLRAGQILGPVFESEHTFKFASVRIKHPVTDEMTWVNVWTSENNRKEDKGKIFCMLLSETVGLKAIAAFTKRQLVDSTSPEAIAKKEMLKEQGITHLVDLESSEDEFEKPKRVGFTEDMVSEEVETMAIKETFVNSEEVLKASLGSRSSGDVPPPSSASSSSLTTTQAPPGVPAMADNAPAIAEGSLSRTPVSVTNKIPVVTKSEPQAEVDEGSSVTAQLGLYGMLEPIIEKSEDVKEEKFDPVADVKAEPTQILADTVGSTPIAPETTKSKPNQESAETMLVVLCDWCDRANNVGRRLCDVCHRPLFYETVEDREAKRMDLQDFLGFEPKDWISKPKGRTPEGTMRRNCRKMVKKAKRAGFNTIKEYFLGHEGFRMTKLKEGFTRANIHELDDVANTPPKDKPQSRKVRDSSAKKRWSQDDKGSSEGDFRSSEEQGRNWTAAEWSEWWDEWEPQAHWTGSSYYTSSWSSSSSSRWTGSGSRHGYGEGK